jgi:hypothetical protein
MMQHLHNTLEKIFNFYRFEPLDDLTLKHINAHAQSIIPGPYRVVFDIKQSLLVVFDWESPEQQTWYTLKWT